MSEKKETLFDSFMKFMEKLSEPMTKFGNLHFIQAITRGMMSSVGVTMIGSIFLVFYLLCSDGGLTEKALLPFMRPYATQLALVNSLSMGIMAIYLAISIGAEYANIKKINKTTGAIGAVFAFILLNYNVVAETVDGKAAFEIANWGGAGVITAIIAATIAVNVINLCYKYNIKIKLPSSVPPAIADSFSSIIPYLFTAIICWGIRTIFNIDIPQLISDMLLPIFSTADNIFVYSLSNFLVAAFWVCGLHGDNIVGAVTSTFTSTWMIENVNAFNAGEPLPYIWTSNLSRLSMWVASCWPVLVYMFMSSKKLPQLKPLATICAPSAVFSIIEPMMFGLPIVLNPFLAIPLILSHTIAGAIVYFATQIGFIGRMYINLPWATPAPILGYLSTGGSIGGVIVVIFNFLLGMVIFYPFWKAYENSELKKLAKDQAEQENLV